MYGLPSNMKSSSHNTWQTSLLFLKPLQIQNLKRKKWGGHDILCPPHLKKWGACPPSPPPNRPHDCHWNTYKEIQSYNHRIKPGWTQYSKQLKRFCPAFFITKLCKNSLQFFCLSLPILMYRMLSVVNLSWNLVTL